MMPRPDDARPGVGSSLTIRAARTFELPTASHGSAMAWGRWTAQRRRDDLPPDGAAGEELLAAPHPGDLGDELVGRYGGVMATLRFGVPADEASAVLKQTSDALTALFALDAHMQHHLDWLTQAAETFGKGPDMDDDETRDARALANAQTERMRALRTDLAELAADATSQLAPGEAAPAEIVREPDMMALPDTVGPGELSLVERSFSAGMARYVHTASMALRPLRRRLYAFGDEPSVLLAEHVDAFLAAVHS